MHCWLRVVLSASAALSNLDAQIIGGRWETLREFDGLAASDGLGWAVAGPGDLNGDGRDDVALGAPFATVGGAASVGSVLAYSGADGALLWRTDGVKFGDQLGKALAAAGDVDADGTPDVIAGAPMADPNGRAVAGTAYVYSGRDGRVLWQFDGGAAGNMLGWAVSGAGDVNADSHADLLVGAPDADPGGLQNAGLANVYSGADGTLLWRFQGAAWFDELGRALAAAGDLDADGFDDVLIGAPGDDAGGTSAGSAFVFSGADGSLLRRFDGAGGDELGRALDAGDADGDSVPDFLLGAPGSGLGAGAVLVHSGSSGAQLWRADGGSGERFGAAVAFGGDADGLGADDVLAGNPARGQAHLFAGANGRQLRVLDGNAAAQFGWAVAAAGDPDSDGFADLLVGAPAGAGLASMQGLDPFLSLSPRHVSTAANALEFRLAFPAGAAGDRYRILASASGTGPWPVGGLLLPLSPDALTKRTVRDRWPPHAVATGLHGRLDAQARAGARLDFPQGLPAASAGCTIFWSALCGPPGRRPRYAAAASALFIAP